MAPLIIPYNPSFPILLVVLPVQQSLKAEDSIKPFVLSSKVNFYFCTRTEKSRKMEKVKSVKTWQRWHTWGVFALKPRFSRPCFQETRTMGKVMKKRKRHSSIVESAANKCLLERTSFLEYILEHCILVCSAESERRKHSLNHKTGGLCSAETSFLPSIKALPCSTYKHQNVTLG